MKAMVLTGASSGIGRALALRAARAGMGVLAVGRDAGRLAELARDASEAGLAIETLAADVGDPAAPKQIVERALARFGRIDVLVNNAGHADAGRLIEQSDAALRRQFATHVVGPLRLTQEAREALRAARGQVIMIGSGVARIPVDGLGAYPAAKAALRSATTSLRRELRADRIAVTYVDPGVVDTPFMHRAGLKGAPKEIHVSPEAVARKIFDAIATRAREVNAVPWQTAAVGLGERFPLITDVLMARSAQLVGTVLEQPPAEPEAPAPPEEPHESAEPQAVRRAHDAWAAQAFENALEAHARRMERASLRPSFVRGLLVPGARLELGDVAMRWAGMPNKHERALTLDVLQSLEGAGYLEPAGEDAWTVIKAPPDGP